MCEIKRHNIEREEAGRLRTFFFVTDIQVWACVGSTLGILGYTVLTNPVKIVRCVLSITTKLIILKMAGVICRQGGRLVSSYRHNFLA